MSGSKYQVLLLALILLLVAYPVFRGPLGSPILAQSLLTVMFLVSGWVVFTEHRLRVLGAVLSIPALLGVWTGYALPEQHGAAAGEVFFHLSAMVFQVFVLTVLLRGVHRGKTVTVDAVAAALCGYLLLGIAFGHLFSMIEALIPGSFNGLPPDLPAFQSHFLLTYFSFITLTTVGYGDMTPAKDTVRAVAMVEAVTGQFYMAVLVADLIGKRVAQALSSESSAAE